jgi:hypothetical protein
MQSTSSPFHPPQAPESRALHQTATIWLAVSLVSSIACASLCLGLGGAVFCFLSMQAATHGLLDDARDKLKWGKVLTLVGSGIGLLSTLVSLAFR